MLADHETTGLACCTVGRVVVLDFARSVCVHQRTPDEETVEAASDAADRAARGFDVEVLEVTDVGVWTRCRYGLANSVSSRGP